MSTPLTFQFLTDLALAVTKGRMKPDDGLGLSDAADLGPLVEFALRLEGWGVHLGRASPLQSRLGDCLRSARRSKAPVFDFSPEGDFGFLTVTNDSTAAMTAYADLDIK